jgi:hypothetical protein
VPMTSALEVLCGTGFLIMLTSSATENLEEVPRA